MQPRPPRIADLFAVVEWGISVRAERHTVVDPSRVFAAGERLVFRAGPLEQRLLIEVVDVAGRRVPVAGRIEVRGDQGYALGQFQDGLAELRPSFGKQRIAAGPLRGAVRLADGETFAVQWPEAVWTKYQPLTLQRGTGLAPDHLPLDGRISMVHGVGADGSYCGVARDDPPWVPPRWWEPLSDGGIRVVVPDAVRQLWCIGRPHGSTEQAERIAVAERVAGAFRLRWHAARRAVLANAIAPDGLNQVRAQARIPGLPAEQRTSWLSLRTWGQADLANPLQAYCPEGLPTRVWISRRLAGQLEVTQEPAIWR